MPIGTGNALPDCMQTNPHEAAARARKVLRVVTYLQCGPLSAGQLAGALAVADESTWLVIAHQSGVTPCSLQTRTAIVDALIGAARRAA